MSSRNIILICLVATLGMIFVTAISMGYGSNTYLFQDGSYPLTANWDADLNITASTFDAEDFILLSDAGVIYWGSEIDTDLFRQGVGELKTSGAFISLTLDTGQGANELYDMDQNVLTTSDVNFNDIIVDGQIRLDRTELEIIGGEITVTNSYHTLNTEEDGATDDLETILGGSTGHILILRTALNTRDVTVKHNVGNILLAGADFTFDTIYDRLFLMYDSSGSRWYEISRSDNA